MRFKILVAFLLICMFNIALVSGQGIDGLEVKVGDKWDFELIENTGQVIFFDADREIDYRVGDILELEITSILPNGIYGYSYNLESGVSEQASNISVVSYFPNVVNTDNWAVWTLDPSNRYFDDLGFTDISIDETTEDFTLVASKTVEGDLTNVSITYYKSTGVLKEGIWFEESLSQEDEIIIRNITGAEPKTFFLSNYEAFFNFLIFVLIVVGISIVTLLYLDRMKSYFQILLAFDIGVILFHGTFVLRDILYPDVTTFVTTAIASTLLALSILLGAFRFSYHIRRPYKAMVTTTERVITNKDLSPLPGKNIDVSGELVRVNNAQKNAIEMLANIFKDIKTNTESLNNALTRTINESDQVEADIKSITNDVDQILQSAATISESIEETRKDAVAILDQITVNFDALAELSNIADRISDQTNLIAVNAAIEAAQTTFESNFGTVADGIQQLASRSRDNTDKLQTSINKVRRSLEGQISKFTLQLDKLEEDIIQLGEISNRSSSFVHQQMNYISTIQSLLQDAADRSEEVKQYLDEIHVD